MMLRAILQNRTSTQKGAKDCSAHVAFSHVMPRKPFHCTVQFTVHLENLRHAIPPSSVCCVKKSLLYREFRIFSAVQEPRCCFLRLVQSLLIFGEICFGPAGGIDRKKKATGDEFPMLSAGSPSITCTLGELCSQEKHSTIPTRLHAASEKLSAAKRPKPERHQKHERVRRLQSSREVANKTAPQLIRTRLAVATRTHTCTPTSEIRTIMSTQAFRYSVVADTWANVFHMARTFRFSKIHAISSLHPPG